MAISSRLPARRHAALLFAACAFPVYTWSIFRFLEKASGWLFYLNVWEMIGIFAYTQVFALLESAAMALVLILAAAIAPARFFRSKFVAIGSMAVLLTAAWAVLAQYNDQALRQLPAGLLLLAAALYLASLAAFYLLIQRRQRVERLLNSAADRLLVLLYVYLPLSLVSAVIVLLRNV